MDIQSSVSKVEELISLQNADQNTMMLYYANLGRSNESNPILFCIDNPYAFEKSSLLQVIDHISSKAAHRIANFADQKINEEIYLVPIKYCYLLWLCCVSLPLEGKNFYRVKNLFKILAASSGTIPDAFGKSSIN